MQKIYCIKCKKNRKFKNPEISNIFCKTVIFIILVTMVVSVKVYLQTKNQLRY